MGKTSRVKGAVAEREVAALLGYARNARNGLEAGDLAVPAYCNFVFEVKRRAVGFGTLYEAIEQASHYAKLEHATRIGGLPRVPVALVRDDRKGWLVTLRLEDAANLIPGLRAGEEEGAP